MYNLLKKRIDQRTDPAVLVLDGRYGIEEDAFLIALPEVSLQ